SPPLPRAHQRLLPLHGLRRADAARDRGHRNHHGGRPGTGRSRRAARGLPRLEGRALAADRLVDVGDEGLRLALALERYPDGQDEPIEVDPDPFLGLAEHAERLALVVTEDLSRAELADRDLVLDSPPAQRLELIAI